LQSLKEHIERHDLGERGGVPRGVGIAGIEDGARIGVDHDVRIGRRIGEDGGGLGDSFTLCARVGWVGGGRNDSDSGD
jgi:hypothetical protein